MKFSEYVALTLKVKTCSVVIARKITNFSLIFWLLNYGHVKSDKKKKATYKYDTGNPFSSE